MHRACSLRWLDFTASKFYDWRGTLRQGERDNGWGPRDFWLEDWEKQAIIGFPSAEPAGGYRRLTLMMLDADIVAVTSSVWRVLSQAGLMSKSNGKLSKKGTGSRSRFIVNRDIRKSLTESDIEINLQGTKEKYPEVSSAGAPPACPSA